MSATASPTKAGTPARAVAASVHSRRAAVFSASRAEALALLWVVLVATPTSGGGCAGAPWFLGEPLDGKPAIPPTSRALTVADHRRRLEQARARGEKVLELAALNDLEQRGALRPDDSRRLVDLLKERGRDWIALRRPIPLAQDLRHIVALDPSRARPLASAVRSSARAAGDRWLAIGENQRAEEEYRRAERMGAPGMLYRMRAAWGASPGDLDVEVLGRALAELPDRSLAPFATAYLNAGGKDPRLVRRAWTAARVYGPPELRARLEKVGGGASGGGEGAATPPDEPPRERTNEPPRERTNEPPRERTNEPTKESANEPAKEAATAPATEATRAPPAGAPASTVAGGAVGPAPAPAPVLALAPAPAPEPGSEDRLYHGPTLARVLLPLARVYPRLAMPGPRSREWSDRLLAEDPTSPESLEFAALVDALAGRLDGAARKLSDLVFYSPDRAAGYAVAATVWERAGEGRRACLAWERAARSGANDDPRWCNLMSCVRENPGAGDPVTIAHYVRQQAPDLTCGPAETPRAALPPAQLP